MIDGGESSKAETGKLSKASLNIPISIAKNLKKTLLLVFAYNELYRKCFPISRTYVLYRVMKRCLCASYIHNFVGNVST